MAQTAVNDVPKRRLLLLSGNAHPGLASEVAGRLETQLCDVKVGKFKNGESSVQINESVRDCDAFVLQPTCNPNVNDYLMELLLMCDALRRAGAWRITAVVPFYAYARQDKSDGSRAPIAAKYVTDAIALAGAARIVTVDLHACQIQGMTSQPFEVRGPALRVVALVFFSLAPLANLQLVFSSEHLRPASHRQAHRPDAQDCLAREA